MLTTEEIKELQTTIIQKAFSFDGRCQCANSQCLSWGCNIDNAISDLMTYEVERSIAAGFITALSCVNTYYPLSKDIAYTFNNQWMKSFDRYIDDCTEANDAIGFKHVQIHKNEWPTVPLHIKYLLFSTPLDSLSSLTSENASIAAGACLEFYNAARVEMIHHTSITRGFDNQFPALMKLLDQSHTVETLMRTGRSIYSLHNLFNRYLPSKYQYVLRDDFENERIYEQYLTLKELKNSGWLNTHQVLRNKYIEQRARLDSALTPLPTDNQTYLIFHETFKEGADLYIGSNPPLTNKDIHQLFLTKLILSRHITEWTADDVTTMLPLFSDFYSIQNHDPRKTYTKRLTRITKLHIPDAKQCVD